ncbi:hypothetical protein IP90_03092 [Luteimonas cucumeris]|uniref:Uncharacterized protein n=1 Tax=Luteimonas cucumeris TaxID=985012 RepID=A0A562KVU6_9GAMM|nr:hypothetical protein [Luteimonas cucumeris]TWH99477.1 hypothetical protein IP90_03092 [Luteimonas cucumeris]
MKLHHTLLAAVLLAVAAPVFAEGDDAVIYNDTFVLNSIWVDGFIYASGDIAVASESGAVVDQDQTTAVNGSYGDGDNEAYLSGDAMSDAAGNIGANVAAGVGNAQANDAALSAVDGEDVFAHAMVFNSQTTLGNEGFDDGSSGSDLFYTAYATDNVLADAAGNIGLNVAAGVGNAQTNALAASVNSSGNIAKATADSEQTTFWNTLLAECDLDNTAYLSGSALSGAIGNIGVNVAAGVGNAQHNGLAIASASCGSCVPPPSDPGCPGGGCPSVMAP